MEKKEKFVVFEGRMVNEEQLAQIMAEREKDEANKDACIAAINAVLNEPEELKQLREQERQEAIQGLVGIINAGTEEMLTTKPPRNPFREDEYVEVYNAEKKRTEWKRRRDRRWD